MTVAPMSFQTELDFLKQNHLHRSLRRIESPQGREVTAGGRRLLNFSSNDYLGLASDPRLAEAAAEAARRWGTGSGASRLLSGPLGIHHELEEKIAAFRREEAAIVFSSGFAANLGAIPALVGEGDAVWIDRFSHASIVDAARLSGARLRVYPHLDAEFLSRWLKRTRARRQLIVTDSYFSMDGDIAPLGELADLAGRHGATLMVDEAHATGVFGPTGRGLLEEAGLEGRAGVVMGTFSKAFGSSGGFVAGRKDLIEFLANRARTFIYTTGSSPASSAASVRAIEICQSDAAPRERLWRNVRLLRQRLEAAGFDLMRSRGPIIPVLVKDTARALGISEALLETGILLPAIRPPTVPQGTDRLRISVTAAHTEEDLARLVQSLRHAFN